MDSKRVVVAVSGTIEEGFELRKNIDWPGRPALYLGLGLCRGAKMYFDLKECGCREYDAKTPARVNPAMVLTGNEKDANQYSIYLVDERACMAALLGEPRYLAMAPDALRIDLDDECTSEGVRDYARTLLGDDQLKSCAVLSVVCSFATACRLEEAPPFLTREDGTRITNFRRSLAIFAGIPESGVSITSKEWQDAVGLALEKAAKEHPAQSESIYATNAKTPRLSSTAISDQDLLSILKKTKTNLYQDFMPYISPVKAAPYNFPFSASLSPKNTCLICIDLQRDFTDPGGYMAAMGYDVTPLAKPLKNVAKVLGAARAKHLPIIHTRQGYRPDLADCPSHIRQRFTTLCDIDIGSTTGPLGKVLIRDQPGWQLNDFVKPLESECIVDKTACDAFLFTDLELILRTWNITNLVFCGNTLDVCVHSTLRHASDLGFQNLLLQDCCGAVSPTLHAAMIESVQVESGIFGTVSNAEDFISALERVC